MVAFLPACVDLDSTPLLVVYHPFAPVKSCNSFYSKMIINLVNVKNCPEFSGGLLKI